MAHHVSSRLADSPRKTPAPVNREYAELVAVNRRVGSSNSQREGYMDESYKSFEPVSDNRGPAIGKSMKAYSGFLPDCVPLLFVGLLLATLQ